MKTFIFREEKKNIFTVKKNKSSEKKQKYIFTSLYLQKRRKNIVTS